MDLDELKTTYKILQDLMKNDHLTKDTSFIRVQNYIANKICDKLIEDENTRNCRGISQS